MKWKIGLIAAALLMAAGTLKYCNRPVVKKTPPAALQPNEKERILISTENDTITTLTPEKTQVVTGIRHASISVSDSGQITVVAHPYGLCLEPGAGVTYRDHVGGALDIQWYYYHDFGANAGIYYDVNVRPYLAVSYSLNRLHLKNSEMALGIDWKKDFLGLFTIRL